MLILTVSNILSEIMRKLFAFVVVATLATFSACAVNLLPYFEFDFDKYIEIYHQLIVNDVYFDEDETPYLDTFCTVLSFFDPSIDRQEIEENIKNQDIPALKEFVRTKTENGIVLSDEYIESILFDRSNMYSAFISPTTDSAMSFFGHNFLIFYIPDAPLLSPCINFYAYYDHLSAIGTVFAGLSGSLVSYYDFQPFFVTFLDYTATRDRSIIMYKLYIDASNESVSSVMSRLKYNTYPNYNFLGYNCSHGFMHILEQMDSTLEFEKDRALSPAMGMHMFDEEGLLSDALFEFPAWNDCVGKNAPKEYKQYYKSLYSGEVCFKSKKPFKNLPLKREVDSRKGNVSSNFSSLSFSYGINQDLEHCFQIAFKPVFNDFFEQSYVDHEIMNLKALNTRVSTSLSSDGRFGFEGFAIDLFSFDSILPFTTLKKRASFGAHLSLGMKDYEFLGEADLYLGMALGRSDIFWFLGVDNYASTVPLEYTLSLKNMIGGRIGPVSVVNTTNLVLYSTLKDYFNLQNEIQLKIDLLDSLSFKGSYVFSTMNGITSRLIHRGEFSIIYSFNIF